MKLLTKNVLAAALLSVFALGSMSSALALSRKAEDNLFFAASNDPIGLDPALVNDNYSGTVNCNIYESLLKFNDLDTGVSPSLAESWTISDDGLVYTFKLRQGVKFHDGTPFNADAVKFNFDRQSPENMTPNMAYAPLVFSDVVKTEVVDEYTVRVTLKQSSTPFLRNMAMCFAAPIASPTALKAHNNNLNENPVGTGPYKFVAWDRGQQIILTAFEDYWGEAPKTANVIIKTMKETGSRVVALANGEIDITNGIDANVVDEITKANNQIFEADGMNVNYMLYNCREDSITSNVEVRRAIAQAINVPELVESLYKGYASPAHTFFPSFMDGYDKDLQQVAYDPEAAKANLEKLGVKELRFLASSGASYINSVGGQVLAEAIQGYLNKVGVKVNIEVYDWTTYKSKLVTDKWDLGLMGWIGDNGDPDNFISLLSVQDPVSNQGLWHNEEFNALIKQATQVPDGKERIALYQKADRVLAQDVGVLPLSHAKMMLAHRPNVTNAVVHPVGMIFFSKIDKKAE